MKFNILALSLFAGCTTAAIGDFCHDSDGQWGTCETTSWCSSHKGQDPISNLCPNDPDNVKCCFYPYCDSNKGYCDITTTGSTCKSKSFASGYCPGGSTYKCCLF